MDILQMFYWLKNAMHDLDLTKPGIQKEITRRPEFERTTKEVIEKADFRNVRFLANFITATGILKERKMLSFFLFLKTGISAKAQRRLHERSRLLERLVKAIHHNGSEALQIWTKHERNLR